MTRAPDAPDPMGDAVLGHAVAGDGTRIAWHTHRGSGGDGQLEARPSMLLTNGLSTTENFWQHVVASLAPTYRVAHWSYRGHGASESARSGDYAMATHVDDLRRVTEAVVAGDTSTPARPPIHIAFSMGVTVVLELYRRRPDLVRAMVLIAGGADHPYASSAAFRVPFVRGAVRGALGGAARVMPALKPVVRRVAAVKGLVPLAQAVGAIGRDAPRAEVEHFFRTVGAMDMRAYWGTLRSLVDARASDVLPQVRVPVLVLAPERDVMALRADLEALHRAIPSAEWSLFAGTGHALLLEAGGAVTARIQEFLRKLNIS